MKTWRSQRIFVSIEPGGARRFVAHSQYFDVQTIAPAEADKDQYGGVMTLYRCM